MAGRDQHVIRSRNRRLAATFFARATLAIAVAPALAYVGLVELKGVPGARRLFAAARV
jgi:hypothetical protein